MVDRSSLTDEVEEAKRAARTALDTPFGVFDGDEFAAAVETLLTALEAAQARAEKAEASLVELAEVTKPFAEAFRTLSSRWEDHEADWQDALHYPITVSDLRRASDVHSRLPLPPSGVRGETDTHD